jgi:hypothetical protein
MNKRLSQHGKVLSAIAEFSQRGLRCFPCRSDKAPLTKKGFKDATCDPEQHERWWTKNPTALIAIRTGLENKIFVVDVDVDQVKGVDGSHWLRAQEREYGALPHGPTAVTPRGGRHYYFIYPETGRVKCSAGRLAPGIDVRGDSGYVIAPPSVSENGEYRWEVSFADCGFPEPPGWLLDLVREPPDLDPVGAAMSVPATAADNESIESEIDRQLQHVRKAEKGTRNSTLNTAAFIVGKIVGAGAAAESVQVERLVTAAHSCGLEAREARRTISSGMRAGKLKPWRPFAHDTPLHELNRDHFFAVDGKSGFVFREELDPITGRRTIKRIYPSAFELEHCNRLIAVQSGDSVKLVELGKRWLRWARRRQYRGVVFDLSGAALHTYYNQWQDFAFEAASGDCSRFLELLREIICSGDGEASQYLLGWCARAVQEPATTGEVAIVLKGKKGVGKTYFASHFGELFGDHYVEMSHSRHLVGNFNAHLETAIVAFADEAYWAGDKQGEGTLKSVVTSRSLLFERKGIDPQLGPNYVHLIMASNSDWVVPASMDERRFFVLQVNDARREDHAYFSGIESEWQNGGREAFLHHLLNLDISKFSVRRVPQTIALLEQKILSLPPAERWFFGLLQNGDNRAGNLGLMESLRACHASWLDWIETQDLYRAYTEFAKLESCRAGPLEAFGMRLTELLPPPKSGRKRRCQRMSDGTRAWGYEFPTLEECRAHFARKIGFKIDWEPEAEVEAAPKKRF